ncbi:hypothetical protein AB0M20_44720 [Actinoplanes sp. NPDC051633]|uniref:hypothetical protein n=1 Tax=Actinoplanes sp. NPDC051633 TaxID=3155670 RepID=UPI003423D0DD
MDHEPTWVALADAAREAGAADDDAKLADRLAAFLDAPITQLPDAATAGGFVPGGDVLRTRLNALLKTPQE